MGICDKRRLSSIVSDIKNQEIVKVRISFLERRRQLLFGLFISIAILLSLCIFVNYIQISKAQSSPSYSFLKKWNDTFDGPADIAIDTSNTRGGIYVADTGNNRIENFDYDGRFKFAWGSFGSGQNQFRNPLGVAVDSRGDVLVADTGNNRIQVCIALFGQLITPCAISYGSKCVISTGSFPCAGNGDGQFYSPSSIAADKRFGFVDFYVADSQNSRIQKFFLGHVQNHFFVQFATKWGKYGINPLGKGEFKVASGVAVDSNGSFVYVADRGNHRIQQFDSDGHFIREWGSFGTDDGQFNFPLKVAVSSDSFVYVADSQNDRVEKFTSNGTFVTSWGSGCDLATGSGCTPATGNLTLGDGQFNNVGGIVPTEAPFPFQMNLVLVVDTGNNRIQVFTPKEEVAPH